MWRIQGIEAEGYSHPGNIQLPSYQATMKVARKGAQALLPLIGWSDVIMR